MELLFSSFLLASFAAVTSATSVLTPPVLPLIVRNPYLSTWLPNARSPPWERWPMFWAGEEIGFSVLASVPKGGAVYPLLGRPQDSLRPTGEFYNISYPKYLGATYDASTTNLTYQIPSPDSHAEPATIVLSFLSPITPTSTFRQSLPAAYLSVTVEGTFNISVYVDLNGQWVSGDRQSPIVWRYIERQKTSSSVGLKTWRVKKKSEALFTQWGDRAEWGTLYFSASQDVDHQCGTSALLRHGFSANGYLQNHVDGGFRRIMEEEPVFAFSKTFAFENASHMHSSPSKQSVVFTIAHVQDPMAQFASARGLTLMRPLWKSWFPTDSLMIRYHYDDFKSARKLAMKYSDQLAVDAYKSGSTSYVDIVALSARQVLGGTSFAGTPDNPLIFLKEISSDGNCQTVDVIFPAAPFFLYTNPRWLAYLLEPLLEHQLSGQYPNKYSMHDLGADWPNITGHSDGNDEYMPVEECGNMLVMGLALVNSLKYASDGLNSPWSSPGSKLNHADGIFPLTKLEAEAEIDNLDDSWGGGIKGEKQARKWLTRSYPLWKQWTRYLVEFSLEPHNQLSTDDFAGWLALQTNLALKGIVGIKAMSVMAEIIGQSADVKYYRDISHSYIKKWQKFAMARDGTHAKLAYDWYGSWTTLYSLYADALLCFHPSITSNEAFFSLSDTPAPPTRPQPMNPHGQRPLQFTSPPAALNAESDFIPHDIYVNQSNYYAVVMQRYGLPLDSRHLYTKSDWEFEAAAVAEPGTRKIILDRVAKWINETSTDRPLTDLYDTEGDGGFPGIYFMARPVVGGHFAFLALERACGRSG